MRRPWKPISKEKLIVAIISIFIIVSAFILAYQANIRQIKSTYETKVTKVKEELESNKRWVYMPKKTIKAGESIKKSNLTYLQVISSIPEEFYFSNKDFGKIAVVDITSKLPIYKSMVSQIDIKDGVREEEFFAFHLSSNLKENNSVDVRIRFPNGEDYVVLAKKQLKNLNVSQNHCFLWLNEEEILTISSAMVDAYIHKGAMLYTARYLEPSIQVASIVTYEPNIDVIGLIESNPNVIKSAARALSRRVREDMEKRLQIFGEKYQEGGFVNEPQPEEREEYIVNEDGEAQLYPVDADKDTDTGADTDIWIGDETQTGDGTQAGDEVQTRDETLTKEEIGTHEDITKEEVDYVD